MSMSVKFLIPLAAAGILLVSPWAGAVDRPNNQRIDPNDPVVKCKKDCMGEKDSERYESCMLKCNELRKNQAPGAVVPNQKR